MPFFRDIEKKRLIAWKASTSFLSDPARAEGDYGRGFKYDFCLPANCAGENLHSGIRGSAKDYFDRHAIKWHDGQNGNPSTHLCDSMVCCVNFLFPFHDQPSALATILLPLYPDLKEMEKLEDDKYVAFEWIGKQNYLHEKISHNGQRTRGANFTSADAVVKFRRKNGQVQIVLIEWKYTEAYFSVPLHIAKSGTYRTEIYRHLFEYGDCPLSKDVLPDYDSLFYEPFYQFMRQQLLAHEMEKAHELGADRVSLLHISPCHNKDFTRVTSPALQGLAPSATAVWSKLVKSSDRFTAVHTEDMFGHFPFERFPALTGWWHYIGERYNWVKG